MTDLKVAGVIVSLRERIESSLDEGETKTDFVREAVEKELKRRKA